MKERKREMKERRKKVGKGRKEGEKEEGRKQKFRDVNLAENVGQEGMAVSAYLLLCNK